MSLSNIQYDEIMREYERRQDNSRRQLEARRREVYEKLPALSDIDARRASAAVSAAKARLLEASNLQDPSASAAGNAANVNGAGANAVANTDANRLNNNNNNNTRAQLAALTKEAEQLLVSAGYPADYLQPIYVCRDCKDTGYIGRAKCHCFDALAIRYYFDQPGLDETMAQETFENFRLDYYPETGQVMRSGRMQEIPVRSIMENNLRICRQFVENFDTGAGSLLFSGGVGLGKTYLSHAIAGELIRRSHSVVYASAAELFRKIGDLYFAQDHPLDEMNQRLAECDLLILDDLGTEVPSVVTHSVLFQLLNRRIDERKSTIISTNLDVSALSDTYSERSVSRIISEFTLLNFYGEDIRIQKKLAGIHR